MAETINPVEQAIHAERTRLAGSALQRILERDGGPWRIQDLLQCTLEVADFGTRAVMKAVSNFRNTGQLVELPVDQWVYNPAPAD